MYVRYLLHMASLIGDMTQTNAVAQIWERKDTSKSRSSHHYLHYNKQNLKAVKLGSFKDKDLFLEHIS